MFKGMGTMTISTVISFSSLESRFISALLAVDPIKRVASTSSLSGLLGYGSVYTNIYKGLHQLAEDPYPKVAMMAKSVITHVTSKVSESEK